ncbi:MAG: hypothetical protein P8P77_09525, partial [Crocinitomicaceae bacterium]|nr:hypothetical protein [Crocinitomicaceae bacterium]
MQFKMNRRTFYTFIFFICVYLVFSNFYHQVGQTLSYDVYGYYLYLPLTFIYGDLGMQNPDLVFELMERYHSSGVFYQGHLTESGNYVMKYTMGQSILYAPFFFIGHLITHLTSYPSDGFSKPYEISIFIGGIVYTLIGLYFFTKVLLHFFEEKIALLVILVVLFGTNYLLHTSMFSQNPMTHNTLFSCYGIILWLTIKWHKNQRWKTIVYLGLVCGLATLIRPTEIVCILIPLLWNVGNKESLAAKLQLFKSNYIQIVTFPFVVLCVISLQLIYFKIYTGSFFFMEYNGNNGEGLDLFPPHTLNTLFSFRKGWLIYTPIMVFSLLGFRSLYKRNKTIFWSLFIYFLINLWFVSSWSNWWYASSFSQRALIPSYIVLSISFGYFLLYIQEQRMAFKSVIVGVLALLLFLNLFQTYQYKLGILHGDRMSKDYYFKTFGSLVKEPENDKLLYFDWGAAYVSKKIDEKHIFKAVFKQNFEKINQFDSKNTHSGQKAEILSMENPFSKGVAKQYSELTSKDHVWLRVSCWVYSKVENTDQQFYLNAHANHKGKAYQYEALDSKTLEIP